MYYAVSTSGFEVRRFDTQNEMMDEMDPTAFMQFHGCGPEYLWVAEPSLKQMQVLELAIELGTEVSVYFPEQLVAMGATIYSGSTSDHARTSFTMDGSYNCLKDGRFMKAKDQLVMLNNVFDLPKLSELCEKEDDEDHMLFLGLIDAMINFLTPGRIPEPYVPSGDDSDIPF